MARSNSRAKQAEGAKKLDSWGMVKASNLERAWNSKFAKEGGERLAVSPRVSSSPRAVAYSTPISSPQEFTRSPTLLGSAAPVNEAFFDQRARNFPVWSSYQNVQNQNVQRYSPRGVSVPTTRSHLATLEQPRGATTGYVIPPSKGGKSSNRFTDYTPREVRTGFIIPPSKGGKNLNRFFDNTPEVVHGRSLPTGLHTLSSFYLTHDYPKFLTARVTYSDPASPPRTAPGSLRAKLASTEERVDAQESDLQRAERQWEQERILYGLSPRGDFRSFEARRRMLATDLHLTNEQRRSALLLRTDPHWPGPNIWTERGQLSEPKAMQWAKENGVSGDFNAVKNSKELNDAVLADMKNEGAKGGLSHLEKLVAVCFLTDPWTPENGCLTAANKLQRRAVVEMFKEEFEATKAKGIF